MKGFGEVGESVYGEKADMSARFGDGGIIGDFNAIIMVASSCSVEWQTLKVV